MGLIPSIIPSISSRADAANDQGGSTTQGSPLIKTTTREHKHSLDGNNVHAQGLFRLIDIAQLDGMNQPRVFKWFRQDFAHLSAQYHRFPDKIYGEVYDYRRVESRSLLIDFNISLELRSEFP